MSTRWKIQGNFNLSNNHCENLKSRKAKLCVSLIKHHFKTAHWGLDGCTAPHTNFGSKWRWSASYLSRLTPGERATYTLSAFTFKGLRGLKRPSIMKAVRSFGKSVTNYDVIWSYIREKQCLTKLIFLNERC
jgi:hypothetical protein